MLRLVLVMAIVAGIALVGAPALATTWDLSTDWSAMNTTGGAWSAGDGSITLSPSQGFWQYNTKFAGQVATFDSWGLNNDYVWGECIKNTGAAGLSDYGAIYDAGEVGLFQGCPNVWGTAHHVNTVRWTALDNYDAIVIDAKFSQIYNGNNAADVKVMTNTPGVNDNTTLFTDSIAGYRGDPTHNYAGAIGTHNTTIFGAYTLNNVVAGTVIDFRVSEPYVYDPTTGALLSGHSDTNQTALAVTISTVDVPEPGSMLALGSGLAGLVGFAIRRRRA